MKQRIKYLATIALAAMLFVPAISGAQKMPKKHNFAHNYIESLNLKT